MAAVSHLGPFRTLIRLNIMLHDISSPINDRLAVWPGDTPPSREVLLELSRGDSVTLSTLHATAHLGSHADAPSHYLPSGRSIAEVDLDLYLGPCRVVELSAFAGTRIQPEQWTGPIDVPRILIRTNSYPDPGCFNTDFVALSVGLIDLLASKGVRLIGVDTPSVDLYDSKDLPAHHALGRSKMAILESLVLADVPEGLYELIALPLRLEGFDASPVRAVLRTLNR